mmetsp:Transcript_26880/g.48471  ORF Transcript_26880/g.48471 Transcript_26880/m.48471 type:complete len:231 (-) Transcript_26880:1376-2068(-)
MIPMVSRGPIIISRQPPNSKRIPIHFRHNRRIKAVILLRMHSILRILMQQLLTIASSSLSSNSPSPSLDRSFPLQAAIPALPILGHEKHQIPRFHAQVENAEGDDEGGADAAGGYETAAEGHVDAEGIAVFDAYAGAGPSGIGGDHDSFSVFLRGIINVVVAIIDNGDTGTTNHGIDRNGTQKRPTAYILTGINLNHGGKCLVRPQHQWKVRGRTRCKPPTDTTGHVNDR